jgi:hypothetical protein
MFVLFFHVFENNCFLFQFNPIKYTNVLIVITDMRECYFIFTALLIFLLLKIHISKKVDTDEKIKEAPEDKRQVYYIFQHAFRRGSHK